MKLNNIFFAGKYYLHLERIREPLGKTFICYASNKLADYKDCFLRNGQFVLIFGDAQEALDFMRRHAHELDGIEFVVYAFLPKIYNVPERSKNILNKFKINLYFPPELNELNSAIHNYFGLIPSNVQNEDATME